MNATRNDLKSNLLHYPDSPNPIKAARLANHYSQSHLANLAGVTRNVVVRNENATYESPSQAILEVFYPINTPGYLTLQQHYYSWQSLMRQANYGLLTPDISFADCPVDEHPLTYWRSRSLGDEGIIPLNTISTAFCINQAVLSKLTLQSYLIQSLPESIINALLNAGYNHLLLDQFELAYQRYKRYLHDKALGLGNGN